MVAWPKIRVPVEVDRGEQARALRPGGAEVGRGSFRGHGDGVTQDGLAPELSEVGGASPAHRRRPSTSAPRCGDSGGFLGINRQPAER